MANQILLKRMCQMIAMTYALGEEDVWIAFQSSGSIDDMIKKASDGEFKSR